MKTTDHLHNHFPTMSNEKLGEGSVDHIDDNKFGPAVDVSESELRDVIAATHIPRWSKSSFKIYCS